MHHPDGFLIRYASKGYPSTRVEVYVPEPYTYQRDPMGRILSVKNRNGDGIETVYDDSITPRTTPGDPRLTAYAFRSIRFIRNTSSGEERRDIQGPGWTFVRGSRAPGGPRFRLLGAPSISAAAAAQGGFGGWDERYKQAREHYDRYQYYRERRDRMERDPDASAIDDLENNEHYRDGVDAALGGDPGERLDWIIQQQERQRDALRHATVVINSLPTTSTTDPAYGPWDDVAVPTRSGSQRLGISGRSR
jgi:hypothetical protein